MSDERTPPLGYEKRDVRFGPVLIAGGLVIGLTLLSAFAMIGVFGRLADLEASRSNPRNPLASTVRKEPPQPRLQARPIEDLLTLRAAEDERLHNYAWVDREKGVARVPIERAIDLFLARRGGGSGGDAPRGSER